MGQLAEPLALKADSGGCGLRMLCHNLPNASPDFALAPATRRRL